MHFFLVHLLSSLSFRLHFHRLSSLSSVSLYFIELIPILLFLHSYIPRGSCFPPSLPLSTLFSALALVVVFDPPSSPPPPSKLLPMHCQSCISLTSLGSRVSCPSHSDFIPSLLVCLSHFLTASRHPHSLWPNSTLFNKIRD